MNQIKEKKETSKTRQAQEAQEAQEDKEAKEVIVQKYGGTSVANIECIKNVAERIKSYYDQGEQLLVVVSAMGHTTDNLVDMAYKINSQPPEREMDMLLSTGEQVSISLLAIALDQLGVPAVSFHASQIKILTDDKFMSARIKKIDTSTLRKSIALGNVCIVAGFQGVDQKNNITTLGRGGSDTSAVALASALKSKVCEIFTDVEGVYTADPNQVSGSKKLKEISYDEMLELASLGAGVLHPRAVEFAKKYEIKLHVRSSFNGSEGTLVMSEDKMMEQLLVSGVSLKTDEARFSVTNIPDRPGVAAELFRNLAEKNIYIDMIVQSTGENKLNTISFTVLKAELAKAKSMIEEQLEKWQSGKLAVDEKIAIVSVVGIGMKSHAGVAACMFEILAKHSINIEMISTSEIKISCVISDKKGKEAVRLIHDALIDFME